MVIPTMLLRVLDSGETVPSPLSHFVIKSVSEGGRRGRGVCLSAADAVLILHQVRLLGGRHSALFRHITGHDPPPHGALHLAEVDARRRQADVVPEICAGRGREGESKKIEPTK